MIWLAPWALLGVIGIALPTLIHLLGRGHAQRRRFPSLRFLTPSRLLPSQRTRIHDPWLLVVRASIVALAAIGLARPLVVSSGRKRSLDRGIARVAIVDTSDGSARTALDSARAFVNAAQGGVVVESAEPRNALVGAANWLARQGRRSEIAIYSSFPVGSIDSVDLAALPPTVGLRLIQRFTENADSAARVTVSGRVVNVLADHDGRGATTAQWTSVEAMVPDLIRLLAPVSDATALHALATAMREVPVRLPVDTSQIIAVAFPNAPERPRLEASATPVHTPWMVARLARMPAGLQSTRSAEGQLDGRPALLFFPTSPTASPESARLVAAIVRSGSPEPAVGRGAEPIAAATLARWGRAASSDAAASNYRPDDGHSDARWVWGAVLLLHIVELWLRRSRNAAVQVEAEARSRAA